MAESALQAFMRLCIMVGVVVVGGMAYHLYGPPAGEASALLDRIVQQARRSIEEWQSSGPVAAAATQPAPSPVASELTAYEPAGFPVSSQSSEMAPLAPLPPAMNPLPQAMPAGVESLLQQLRGLGVEDVELTEWGAEGALHRFTCTAPLPGEAGFVRHFDAIEPDAQLAVARVYDQVQAWRATQCAMAP